MPGCMKHKLDKIAERNITNLRYADDSSFRAESEEELKSFSVKVKQETVQAGLKLNIQEGGAKMAEEPEIIANIHCIIEKAREFQKNI